MNVPDFLPNDSVMKILLVSVFGVSEGKYFPPEQFENSRRMLSEDSPLKWTALNMTENNLEL
jgi:hypothetical protein